MFHKILKNTSENVKNYITKFPKSFYKIQSKISKVSEKYFGCFREIFEKYFVKFQELFPKIMRGKQFRNLENYFGKFLKKIQKTCKNISGSVEKY